MTTVSVELPRPAGLEHLSDEKLAHNSSLMARLLALWIVIIAVATFITVPWLRHANNGDFTVSLAWFYHALMLPSALLFLILCTRVFTTHKWVRYVVTHSAPMAILEGAGFLILGYGTQDHITSLVDFGYWIIMPLTIELFAVTLLFVGDLAVSAFWPPAGERMPPQRAEINWALFFAGVSVLTWVVLGIIAAASVVGVNWTFWAHAQNESTSTLMGNIITSHSHGMLPSFMAGIVFLAAEAFGYSKLSGLRKQVARSGVGIMLGGIALYSGVYLVSALGTFVIPAWFPSGPGGVNGLAMDDTFTGLVGLGALVVAFTMIPEIRGTFHRAGETVKARFNPVRLGVYMTYLMATAAMFGYGYYNEMNENKFGFATTLSASRVVGDQIFTRAHLLLVFGSLPVIAVFLMAAELIGDTDGLSEQVKRVMSAIVLVGMVVATAGLGIWTYSTPLHATTWSISNAGAVLYMAGQALILLGAAVELFTFRNPSAMMLSPSGTLRRFSPDSAALASADGGGDPLAPGIQQAPADQ
ncbi:MAG: hypothetical protein ACP5H2_08395 [Solirubrobacteraceae bacterium]